MPPIRSGTTIPSPNNTPGLHQGNPRPPPKRTLRLTPTRQIPPSGHANPFPSDLRSPPLEAPKHPSAANQQQLLTPGSNGSSTHGMTTRSSTSAALERGAPLDDNSPTTPSAPPSSSNGSGAGSRRCRDESECDDDKIHETRSVAKRRKGAESSVPSAPPSEQSVFAASGSAGHGDSLDVPLPGLQRTRGAQREFEEELRKAE